MKSFLVIGLMAVVGCASVPKVEPQDNEYADYGRAMAHSEAQPLTVYWQDAHRQEIDEATTRAALIAVLKTPAAAAELLAEIKPAYQIDPKVAMKIAAVSQLSMCPKLEDGAKLRASWTTALLKRARNAEDVYVKLFCLDQLRWCGHSNDAQAVNEIGEKSGEKSVADFAAMVARELGKAK